MDLKELIDINTGKLKNAKWRKKAFENAVKHVNIGINQNGLSEAETDVKFYSIIEKILKAKSNNPMLNEFLRVSIKDEWIQVEIQVIVQDMLKEKDEAYKKKLNRWYELLKTDGINSKLMVANDIQALLKELE